MSYSRSPLEELDGPSSCAEMSIVTREASTGSTPSSRGSDINYRPTITSDVLVPEFPFREIIAIETAGGAEGLELKILDPYIRRQVEDAYGRIHDTTHRPIFANKRSRELGKTDAGRPCWFEDPETGERLIAAEYLDVVRQLYFRVVKRKSDAISNLNHGLPAIIYRTKNELVGKKAGNPYHDVYKWEIYKPSQENGRVVNTFIHRVIDSTPAQASKNKTPQSTDQLQEQYQSQTSVAGDSNERSISHQPHTPSNMQGRQSLDSTTHSFTTLRYRPGGTSAQSISVDKHTSQATTSSEIVADDTHDEPIFIFKRSNDDDHNDTFTTPVREIDSADFFFAYALAAGIADDDTVALNVSINNQKPAIFVKGFENIFRHILAQIAEAASSEPRFQTVVVVTYKHIGRVRQG